MWSIKIKNTDITRRKGAASDLLTDAINQIVAVRFDYKLPMLMGHKLCEEAAQSGLRPRVQMHLWLLKKNTCIRCA